MLGEERTREYNQQRSPRSEATEYDTDIIDRSPRVVRSHNDSRICHIGEPVGLLYATVDTVDAFATHDSDCFDGAEESSNPMYLCTEEHLPTATGPSSCADEVGGRHGKRTLRARPRPR